MTSSRVQTLHKLAEHSGKAAYIEALIENSILKIRVVNPFPMTDIERGLVIKKISEAERYSNIMDYFSESNDDPYKEGAGLGLIFIGMMLNSLGLNISSLSIESSGCSTTAVLSVPLNRDTVEIYRKNTENGNAFQTAD